MATVDGSPEVVAGRYCPGCGYDLRGLPVDGNCPECGRVVGAAATYRIPWERRAEFGRLLAFIQTVWLATARPARLADAAAGPVDVRAARSFRRLAVLVVAAGVAAAWYAAVAGFGTTAFVDVGHEVSFSKPPPSPAELARTLWSAGAMLRPVLLVAVLATLALGFGTGHWLALAASAEPPARRGRLIAASFYAAGSAVAAVVPVGMTTLVFLDVSRRQGWPFDPTDVKPLHALLAAGTAAVAGWAFVLCHVRLVLHGTRSLFRVVVVGTGLLAQWAVAVVIGMGGVPLACGALRLMWDSLR